MLIALALLAFAKPLPSTTEISGWAMTMPYRVTVGEPLDPATQADIQQVIETTFVEIDETFNNWNPNSEISRINRAAAETPIPLSSELEKLLTLCDQLYHISGGRFDPTVAPLVSLWRERLATGEAPTARELLDLSDATGWEHLTLRQGELVKHHPLTSIDLCAISKGLALDWLVERICALGYPNLLVEWAGELRANGRHPEGRDWSVQIDPGLTIRGESLHPLPLRDAAIATSGDYAEKGWTLLAKHAPDKKLHHYCHIIDPHTLTPLEKTTFSIAAVTVIAPSCALADALATAAMVFPTRTEAEKWAQEVVELFPQASFLILSYDYQNLSLRPGERPPLFQP